MAKPEIKCPRKADVMMLFDRAPRLDLEALVFHLNAKMPPGAPRAQMNPSGVITVGEAFLIMISVADEPLRRRGFELALGSMITRSYAPAAEEAIKLNSGHVFVSVCFGAPPPDLTPELEDFLDATGGWPRPDVELFLNMLTLAQWVTSWVNGQKRPSLIHWMQSDQLFSADTFENLVRNNCQTLLHVHSFIYAPGDLDGMREKVGAISFGAAHLIGRDIEFEPAEVPPTYIMERIAHFVDIVRKHRKGELIPHGETFGIDENEVIRVLHTHPTTERPQGGITLRLESGPGGKAQPLRPPPPTREAFQPAKLDKDVEADRALIKAMRQSLISQSAGNSSPKAQQPAATAAPSRKSGVLGKIKTAIKSAVLVYAAIVAMSMISMFLAKDLMSAHKIQHNPNIVQPAKP